MTKPNLQQGTPIVVRGGNKSGIIPKPISINADGVFQVTQEFQAQPTNWVESSSEFVISYVESINVGQMGSGLQYCQTSSMSHPLRYEFKDDKSANIFTITEVPTNGGFSLKVDVLAPNDFFHITEESKEGGESWVESAFDQPTAEVYAVEVVDSTNTPVCRLIRSSEEDIYLNLEPAS